VAKKRGKRQRIRKALLLISLLSFPVIISYLSPYVIIDGAMNGVVNGSMMYHLNNPGGGRGGGGGGGGGGPPPPPPPPKKKIN
jgi:hypothetical protein